MKKFAVIGNPIKHSLSPIMHNWIFGNLGLEAKYEKIHVKQIELPHIIKKIRNGELDGINVTIPYKQTVIKLLDKINDRARFIGAVNCIMKSKNHIMGNNTDWYGFAKSLKKNGIDVNNKEIIVLGAGGAARSVLFSLQQMGVQRIYLINRTIVKSKMLETNKIIAYAFKETKKLIKTDSIIINTTSLGMQNNQFPIDSSLIHKNQILIDIIYSPLTTSFLKYGKEVGSFTLNGLDMFIEQGLASLDLWFGSSVSKQVNLLKLKTYLESQLC